MRQLKIKTGTIASFAAEGIVVPPVIPLVGAGVNIAEAFPRGKLLILQFTKLLNYWSDDLAADWGGHFYTNPSLSALTKSLNQFLEDVRAYDSDIKETWLHKKYEQLPWGPGNFKLRPEPSLSLGAPYEPYLSAYGGILTVNQASRLLNVDARELVALKLRLLLDERVIAEAVKRMLKPRPEWPRVVARQGTAGKVARTVRK